MTTTKLDKGTIKEINCMFVEISDEIKEDDFQKDFFESIQKQFEARLWLSDKQMAALLRMHERIVHA